MAKNRKARRNSVAHATKTGKLPIAAYREMRAANAPYEGYTVDVYRVPDELNCHGHHGDAWSYWVRDRQGRALDWWTVVSEAPEGLSPRHRQALYGRHLPLEIDALRVRFPGARVTEHSGRPEGCDHNFVAYWIVHRDCGGSCEALDKQRETAGKVEAEETWEADIAAWDEEGKALNAVHDQETEAAALQRAALQKTGERYTAALTAAAYDLIHSDPMLSSYYDDLAAFYHAEGERMHRHIDEYNAWRARQPATPEHWRAESTAA
ncbi:hypothetical protein ABZ726_01600 [Streptomyces hundungensis]|uniref:hypothetical protein n=1 Tax=Streptomyces hundungensis TaxID=1077946 RepID=UPI0033CBB09A